MTKYCFFVFFIYLTACSTQYHLAKVDQENIRFEQRSSQQGLTRIDSIIGPYKLALDEKMNLIIGEAAVELTKERVESTLGNWVADALVNQAEMEGYGPISFAVQNYGGLRISSIAKGPVNIGKIYELMPFDNIMVVMEAKGDIVLKLMERIAAYGGWPISADVRMVISDDKLSSVTIKGKPVDIQTTYRFILPDYIADGGDDCDFLASETMHRTNFLIRDALIEELKYQTKMGKKIEAKKENRIVKN